jgi:tRNA C32,U32 (ribose-2'-O)-methylase TrmJ
MNSPLSPNTPLAVGRPRALDNVKLREISALISAGCGLEGAARYVGCAASTIRREARRNPDFNEQLRRAHLAAELGPLNAMRNAANKHWRAAAWLLERTNAQRFAKQNVRHIKPEQLQQFSEVISGLLLQEIPDHNTRRRILRRLDKFIQRADANLIAAELDPCP